MRKSGISAISQLGNQANRLIGNLKIRKYFSKGRITNHNSYFARCYLHSAFFILCLFFIINYLACQFICQFCFKPMSLSKNSQLPCSLIIRFTFDRFKFRL